MTSLQRRPWWNIHFCTKLDPHITLKGDPLVPDSQEGDTLGKHVTFCGRHVENDCEREERSSALFSSYWCSRGPKAGC